MRFVTLVRSSVILCIDCNKSDIEMIEFESISECFKLSGKPQLKGVPVLLHKDMDNVEDLIGDTVLVDDEEIFVIGVERFAHAPPWKEGEAIALAFRV